MHLKRSRTANSSDKRDSFVNENVIFVGAEQDWCLYTDKSGSSRNSWSFQESFSGNIYLLL